MTAGGGSVLPGLREAVMQGCVRTDPKVQKPPRRLVERWHNLMHGQRDPTVPIPPTARGLVRPLGSGARLTRGFGTGPGTSASYAC